MKTTNQPNIKSFTTMSITPSGSERIIVMQDNVSFMGWVKDESLSKPGMTVLKRARVKERLAK